MLPIKIFAEFPLKQINKARETASVSALEKETKHFVGITSIDGLQRVYQSKGWARMFWISMVFVCSIILLWTSSNILSRFFAKPTTSEVSFIISQKGLLFPKLTFCNVNPVRKSYIQEQNRTGDFSIAMLQYLLQSTTDAQHLYATTSEDALSRNEDALLKYIQNHSDFSIKKFFDDGGFTCQEMLKQCVFAGRTFDCCLYSTSVLTNFGKCQVLNLSDSNIEWLRKQREEGVDGGLHIVLDARIDEQIDVFSEADSVFSDQYERGFWYYVDDPKSDTHREAEGINVSPGDRIFSSLQAHHYTLLDKHNWGNCSSQFPEEFEVKLRSKYSAKDCLSICKARFFFSQCDCVPFGVNIEGIYNSCTPLEAFQCFKRHIVKDFNESVDDFAWPDCSECAMECDRWKYSVSNAYSSGLSTATRQRARKDNVSIEHMEENYVTLNFYYREMIYTELKQTKDEDFVETLSDIGGVMGLFLGLSVISVIEMIIYLCKIFWIFLSRNRREYLTEKKTREETEEREMQMAVSCIRRLRPDLLRSNDIDIVHWQTLHRFISEYGNNK